MRLYKARHYGIETQQQVMITGNMSVPMYNFAEQLSVVT